MSAVQPGAARYRKFQGNEIASHRASSGARDFRPRSCGFEFTDHLVWSVGDKKCHSSRKNMNTKFHVSYILKTGFAFWGVESFYSLRLIWSCLVFCLENECPARISAASWDCIRAGSGTSLTPWSRSAEPAACSTLLQKAPADPLRIIRFAGSRAARNQLWRVCVIV